MYWKWSSISLSYFWEGRFKIVWIVLTVDTLNRYVGQYIGLKSIDSQTIHWLTVGWHSVDSWLIVCWQLVDNWAIVEWQTILHEVFAECQECISDLQAMLPDTHLKRYIDRLSTESSLTIDWDSTDCWPSIDLNQIMYCKIHYKYVWVLMVHVSLMRKKSKPLALKSNRCVMCIFQCIP